MVLFAGKIYPGWPQTYKNGIRLSELIDAGYYVENSDGTYSFSTEKHPMGFSYWDYDHDDVWSVRQISFAGDDFYYPNTAYLVAPIGFDETNTVMYDMYGNEALLVAPLDVNYHIVQYDNGQINNAAPEQIRQDFVYIKTYDDEE